MDKNSNAVQINYIEQTWTVNRILLIVFFIILFGMMTWTAFFDRETDEGFKGRTVVNFWHGMGGALGDVLHEMIERFNGSQDRIYVKAQHMGSYQALNQKIIASVLAGNPPDMAQAFENWTAKLLFGDAVEQLNSYIEAEGPAFWEDFFPAMRANVTGRNDRIWSIPFNKSQQLMYYNKDLFRTCGLDPESPPRTWEELIQCCDRLTRVKTGDGIVMCRSDYEAAVAAGAPDDGKVISWGTAYPITVWTYCNYLYQLGGNLVTADYTKGLFNTDEGVEALMFMIELIDRYKVAYRTTGRQDQNDFLAEQIGIMVGSSVSRVFMEEYMTFDWGMAPIPSNKCEASIMSGTNVIIFKNSSPEVKIAAWEFIKWFCTSENTAHWSVATTYMPVRVSALKTPEMRENLRKNTMNDAALRQLPYTKFEPPLSAWFQCRDLLQRVLEDATIEYLKEDARGGWSRATRKQYLKRYLDGMNTKMNELLAMEIAQTDVIASGSPDAGEGGGGR